MYDKNNLGLFPDLFIATLVIILASLEAYGVILVAVLFAGFVSIVVNSGKYSKINELFDSLF